jgi:hypothetical protein
MTYITIVGIEETKSTPLSTPVRKNGSMFNIQLRYCEFTIKIHSQDDEIVLYLVNAIEDPKGKYKKLDKIDGMIICDKITFKRRGDTFVSVGNSIRFINYSNKISKTISRKFKLVYRNKDERMYSDIFTMNYNCKLLTKSYEKMDESDSDDSDDSDEDDEDDTDEISDKDDPIIKIPYPDTNISNVLKFRMRTVIPPVHRPTTTAPIESLQNNNNLPAEGRRSAIELPVLFPQDNNNLPAEGRRSAIESPQNNNNLPTGMEVLMAGIDNRRAEMNVQSANEDGTNTKDILNRIINSSIAKKQNEQLNISKSLNHMMLLLGISGTIFTNSVELNNKVKIFNEKMIVSATDARNYFVKEILEKLINN